MSESDTKKGYISDHFLIAMPTLQDIRFKRTVIYICEHNERGAIGIIVNRPIAVSLAAVFEQMNISIHDEDLTSQSLLYGGPVQQERGFVLHRPGNEWRSSLVTGDDVAVTTSQDVLQALADGKGPEDALIALGYAGWGPNQLEQELVENAWLSSPAAASILFETPYDERWQQSAALLGIDIYQLSGETGHA